MQKGRVITAVLQIEEPEASKAIWDAHMEGLVAGCKVLSLGNGDVYKERDEAHDLLSDVAEYLSRRHLGDAEAESLLDRIEEV